MNKERILALLLELHDWRSVGRLLKHHEEFGLAPAIMAARNIGTVKYATEEAPHRCEDVVSILEGLGMDNEEAADFAFPYLVREMGKHPRRTISEVAEQMGVDKHKAIRRLRRQRVPILIPATHKLKAKGKKGGIPREVLKMAELHELGMPLAHIGERFELSRQAVYQRLRYWGLHKPKKKAA